MNPKTIYCIVTLTLAILGVHIIFNQAWATQPTLKYNIIDIVITESCQKQILYNVSNTCPTIKELKKFDTTNKNISGNFTQTKDGTWYREKPQLKNHFMFYKYSKIPVICVDCVLPLGNPDIVKMIFLEPKNFTFVDVGKTITGNTRLEYHDRYVSGCQSATIAYSQAMLIDTIKYLASDCTKTQFNGTKIIVMKETPKDFANNIWYKYKAYLEQLKTATKGNCISTHCITPKNPFKNW